MTDLPSVGTSLPSVIPPNSGQLTRGEADAVFVAQADATGYDDIQTQTDAASTYVAKADATGYDDIQTQTDAAATYVPLAASPMYAQQAALAHTDAVAKTLFTLPAGAIIIGFLINVSVAFNAGDSNVIDIGDAGTPNRFVNDQSTGSITFAWVMSTDAAALPAETVVKGIYVPGGAAATAGAATITVLYIVP